MLSLETLERAKAVSAINAALEIKHDQRLAPDAIHEILQMLDMSSPAPSRATAAPSKKTKNHV